MRSKYGNRKTYVDGIKFDSIKEAKYYIYLRSLARSGRITNLRLQVPFEIVPAVYEDRVVHLKTKDKVEKHKVQSAVHYVADFVYEEDGREVVVDVKSEATKRKDAYILKKKMMRAFLGITIEEA